MLFITLNGGNGLLKAACGSCAAIRAAPSAMNSRLENSLAVGLMHPPLRASVHLIEAQQLRDLVGRKPALFDRHLAHRTAGLIRLFRDGGGAVVTDLGGQRRRHA